MRVAFLGLFLVVIFASCTYAKTPLPSGVEPAKHVIFDAKSSGDDWGYFLPISVPDDFFIIVERGFAHERFHLTTVLDTQNNIIGRDFSRHQFLPQGHPLYIHTEFYISDEDLREIYTRIVRYNMRELNSEQVHTSQNLHPAPTGSAGNFLYRVRFGIDGALYTVFYNRFALGLFDVLSAEQHLVDLTHFHLYIWGFIESVQEFKSLPSAPSPLYITQPTLALQQQPDL